jgi:hypothetical protein
MKEVECKGLKVCLELLMNIRECFEGISVIDLNHYMTSYHKNIINNIIRNFFCTEFELARANPNYGRKTTDFRNNLECLFLASLSSLF